MSQYRLTGKSASRSYELLVGWDTPLSRFFLVIEPELDEPVYSNIYEKGVVRRKRRNFREAQILCSATCT
ncbi:hypothetical protein ACTYWS_004845 [Escherichia coli]